MPQTAVADLTMHYEEHGRPDGPPLVLLHAFTDTGAMWRAQLDAFGARYRLLVARPARPWAHRQPRRPRRDEPPPIRPRHIAFCHALGIERAAFCGESSGAMLLLTLGLEAPDLAAALVLAGRRLLLRRRAARLVGNADAGHAHGGDSDPEAMRSTRGARPRRAGAAWWQAFIALGSHAHADDFPEQEELRGIAAPTLIVHGDRDPPLPHRRPDRALRPPARRRTLHPAATGHFPPVERPDWFNAIVLDFLERRLDSGGMR